MITKAINRAFENGKALVCETLEEKVYMSKVEEIPKWRLVMFLHLCSYPWHLFILGIFKGKQEEK